MNINYEKIKKIIPAANIILVIGVFYACSFNNSGEQKDGTGQDTISTGTVGIEQDSEYGNVLIKLGKDEFKSMGFNLGDSLDAVFSNGYTLEDVPYYTGYYTEAGDPLFVDFTGSDNIIAAINYRSLWDTAKLSDGDTIEITLHQPGEYLDVQNALDIEYEDDRDAYESDEVFANFRSINTGKLKENILYRSASPCDDQHNRAPYVDDLAENAGIKLIADLADSEGEIDGFMSDDSFDSPYFASLFEDNSVIPLNLQVDYTSEDYRDTLVKALCEMSEREGPYLIHCLEGKDRTGFVCALLESLTGADYDEIEKDYMLSYDNYYGINRQSDPERYNVIVNNNLIPMLRIIAGVNKDEDIISADYKSGAEDYLMSGGMTAEEIDALKDRIMQ